MSRNGKMFEKSTLKKPVLWFPTPNTMDSLPQRSEEALRRQARGARKGRQNPANLREAIDPRAVEIYKQENAKAVSKSEESTLFPAVSHAKTFQPLAKVPESQVNALASGKKCTESFAKYDPATFLWRTSQHSFLGGLESFSETWPRSGMTANGIAYRLQPSAPLTREIGFGSWPTPCSAAEAPNLGSNKKNGPKSLVEVANGNHPMPKKFWLTPRATETGENTANFVKRMGDRTDSCAGSLSAQVNNPKTWPTPRAANPGSRPNGKGGKILAEEVMIAEGLRVRGEKFPTPKARQRGDCPSERQRKSPSLESVVKFSTPQARDFRTGQQKRYSDPNRSKNLNDQIGGQLNPQWVEWLMGLPPGWTDLNCSETAKSFRSSNTSAKE